MKSMKQIASRVLLLPLAALFAIAGCGDGFLSSNNGRLRVVMSADGAGSAPSLAADAGSASGSEAQPGDDDDDGERLSRSFTAATLTLSSVLVRNLDGQLVDVDFDLPVTVDVVKLEGGKQVVLPSGILPEGTYDQVVIVITAVQGTTLNGTTVTIEPPGGGWTAVVPICPLEVAAGATETVDIALNAKSSFLRIGSHWDFHPRFRSRLVCETP
jgi:hypothetical protein